MENSSGEIELHLFLKAVRHSLIALLLGGMGACGFIGPRIGHLLNEVSDGEPDTASVLAKCGEDCTEMARLFIADLHADPFLWHRDIRKRSKRGHVDIPRLREGGIDLQVFSVPSFTPLGTLPFATALRPDDPRFVDPEERFGDFGGLKCTDPETDWDTTNSLFALWNNPKRIAFDQARDFCLASGGTPIVQPDNVARFRQCRYDTPPAPTSPTVTEPDPPLFPIRSRADLKALWKYNKDRPLAERAVGGLLSIEGVHWIETDDDVVREVEALKRAGFMMIGLTHKFTNSLGGSDEACAPPPGLTELGTKVVREVLDEKLILDVAHLSAAGILPDLKQQEPRPKTVLQILDERGRKTPEPVVMSHGGVRLPYCRNIRNLPDEHVKMLLRRGVPFGVIHWDAAYCVGDKPRETVVERILDAYAHAIDLTGWEVATQALAIGADLDGAVKAPFDVTGFPYLLTRIEATEWCQGQGAEACRAAVARIAGENVYDVLMASLPETPFELD